MLVTPPCGASSNIALWRAKIKPPVELVVGDLKKLGVFSTEIKFLHGNIFLWINRSFFYIKGVITHRKKKLLFFLEKYRFFLKKTLAFPRKLCYYNEAVA